MYIDRVVTSLDKHHSGIGNLHVYQTRVSVVMKLRFGIGDVFVGIGVPFVVDKVFKHGQIII